MSAARRSRRTPPTSRRWVRASTAFVVAFGAPADTPAPHAVAAGRRHVGGGPPGRRRHRRRRPGQRAAVGDLGDGAGRPRRPARRCAAAAHAPATWWPWPASWAVRRRDIALWDTDRRFDDFAELRRRHLVPEPPYGQGAGAADAGATAMTDVSDGLLADLRPHRDGVRGAASTSPPTRCGADREAVAARRGRVGADALDVGARRRRGPRPGRDLRRSAARGWRVIGRVVDGPGRGAGGRRPVGGQSGAGSRSA